jgi:hypothetical protein
MAVGLVEVEGVREMQRRAAGRKGPVASLLLVSNQRSSAAWPAALCVLDASPQ